MNVTKQQVFDAAWNGLKAQGFERCTWPRLTDDNGRSCAYGHAYKQLGEGVVNKVMPIYTRFIDCHDEATSPADMELRLREFAKAWGLTVPGDVEPSIEQRILGATGLRESPHVPLPRMDANTATAACETAQSFARDRG